MTCFANPGVYGGSTAGSVGLGSRCWVVDSSGNWVDCNSLGGLFNLTCWGLGGAQGGGGAVPVTPPDATYNPPPVSQPDCSTFWNSLTNTQCSISSAIWPIAIVAIGAVILLAEVRK